MSKKVIRCVLTEKFFVQHIIQKNSSFGSCIIRKDMVKILYESQII